MRILYLTQWFEPEPNIIKGVAFVRALERAGHDVTVVTGFPNYPAGRLYPGYRLRPIMRETVDGVKVVRLPLYPSHDSSALRRAANFLSFFLSVLVYSLAQARRFDLIYVYHPPITVGLAAALAGAVRHVPFVLDVQDLWPDTVAASGMSGAALLCRPIALLCRFTHARAAAIIAQSAGMASAIAERGARHGHVVTIRNWASLPQSPARQARVKESRAAAPFTLVYGGNLGRAQGLETVIAAAAILASEQHDIAIRLIGDGVDAAALRRRAQGIGCLSVERAMPRSDIAATFAQADALLLHLRDEPLFRITIPSKLQAYLAAGRPIIGAIAGEAADLLAASKAGIVVAPQNPRALARAIRRMADMPLGERGRMAGAARRFYGEQFSFDRAIAATLDVIEAAAMRASRPGRASAT